MDEVFGVGEGRGVLVGLESVEKGGEGLSGDGVGWLSDGGCRAMGGQGGRGGLGAECFWLLWYDWFKTGQLG